MLFQTIVVVALFSSVCLIFSTLLALLKVAELKKVLIIGVLSGPGNTKQRDAIRFTWGSLLEKDKADLKFIVGTSLCQVPIVDRVTPYVCELWRPQILEDDQTSASNIYEPNDNLKLAEKILKTYVGYTFIVKQSITVVELSVCSSLLSERNPIVRVKLYDSFSGNMIASTTFAYSPQIFDGAHTPRILTKQIRPIKLEASFEGELTVISQSFDAVCSHTFARPSPVYIFEVLDQNGIYAELSTISCLFRVLGGFQYKIHSTEFWKQHKDLQLSRELIWREKMLAVESVLKVEQEKYNDILLVNTVDVYSALQQKTVSFFYWACSQNYDFVLKTDDDVFVDVVKVMAQLQQNTDWDWWTCFKEGWSAPNAGKWRNRVVSPQLYPPFPSGSGYVIKTSSAKKLLERKQLQGNSVGEDVLVGLLASGLNFRKLDKSLCYWTCDEKCNVNPCNVPELSPSQIWEVWKSYNHCNEICNCSF